MRSDGDGMYIRTSGGSRCTKEWGYTARPSPVKDWGKELGYETLIIWAECLKIDGLVALAVKVVWVECAHCGQRALVLFVREVCICTFTVPSENDRELNVLGNPRRTGDKHTGKSCGSGS